MIRRDGLSGLENARQALAENRQELLDTNSASVGDTADLAQTTRTYANQGDS